jgi:hypothetical protein
MVGIQRHNPAALCPGKAAGTQCGEGSMDPIVCCVGCGKYRPTEIRSPIRPKLKKLLTVTKKHKTKNTVDKKITS